jgi:hypothetical protein
MYAFMLVNIASDIYIEQSNLKWSITSALVFVKQNEGTVKSPKNPVLSRD